MDQQCNAIVKHLTIKCSKCPVQRLAITHALSLNHHRSITWSMTVSLSIKTLPRLINMSHCQDSVICNQQDWSRICEEATDWVLWWSPMCHDEAAWQLSAHAHVLAPWQIVLYKLELVLCFRLYKEHKIRLRYEIYLSKYVCQKFSI